MSKKHTHNEEMAEEKTATEVNDTQTAQAEENVTAENEQTTQPEAEKKEETVDIASQFEDMRDKYLRLSAEFDNYRKRTLREKSDILKYGSEEVLKDLLPVVDDLDRALKAIETATDINAVKDGLVLIVNKFNEFLKSKGVKEIDAVGQQLDTDLHEAITKFPAQDESQKGKIIDVIQKGYMLNDKVMRFSKVVVGE
ncbi:MAG: nucleotide exchange factor GrpE [Bacteroidales bacterium]|nr:nucleotide exchange factor GrpE [Bacteroidales bacterium]